MASLDEPKLVFMAAERAEDAVDAVAGETIDRVDTPFDEPFA
jgi:hypothetical protein